MAPGFDRNGGRETKTIFSMDVVASACHVVVDADSPVTVTG